LWEVLGLWWNIFLYLITIITERESESEKRARMLISSQIFTPSVGGVGCWCAYYHVDWKRRLLLSYACNCPWLVLSAKGCLCAAIDTCACRRCSWDYVTLSYRALVTPGFNIGDERRPIAGQVPILYCVCSWNYIWVEVGVMFALSDKIG